MTNKAFTSKAKEYLADVLIKDIKKKIDSLIDSGAIDFDKCDSRTFGKSKTVLKVALEDVANSITLFSSEDEEDYKNLQNF